MKIVMLVRAYYRFLVKNISNNIVFLEVYIYSGTEK